MSSNRIGPVVIIALLLTMTGIFVFIATGSNDKNVLDEDAIYVRSVQDEDFDFLVAELKDAINAENYRITNVAEVGKGVQARGHDLGRMLVVEFCNLELAAKILQKDRRFLSFMPCRIAVYEDKAKISLAVLKPGTFARIFEDPELHQLADSVEAQAISIIDNIVGY